MLPEVSQKAIEAYEAEVELITRNFSRDNLIREMVQDGKCRNPVHLLVDVPLGMFHCDWCWTMVVAGLEHPVIEPPFTPEQNVIAEAIAVTQPQFWEEDSDGE